jgi:uncharacterized protein with von Willebrand factor type A (vWA) domain
MGHAFTTAPVTVDIKTISHALAAVAATRQGESGSPLQTLQAPHRSPEQVAELKRRISFIFGVSSGEFDFEILPHPESWACGFSPEAREALDQLMKGARDAASKLPDEAFRPNAFFYHTEEIASRPELQIAGITHHEAAHAQYTDYRFFVEGMFNASQERSLQSMWATVFNGLEDGRINRMKSASSLAGNKYLGELYHEWTKEIEKAISTQPLMHQFALNCVHRWATGNDIRQITDPRARSLIDVTREAVDQYIASDAAAAAGEVLNNSIWPEAKKLAQVEIKEQALQDLQSERESSMIGKIKRFFKRMLGRGSEQGDLSENERGELEKKFDKLPGTQRENRMRRARSKVDERMTEIHNKNGLKGFPLIKDETGSGEYRVTRQEPPTPEEKEALREMLKEALKDAREQAREKEAEEASREREKGLREQAGFNEDERRLYETFTQDYEAVAPVLDRFAENLKKVLPRDVERLLEGEYLSGPRLDKRLLSRRAPISDGRVFQRRYSKPSMEPLVDLVVLIDNSGSMEGEKIVQARRAALLLLHACDRLGVPCSIRLFAHSDSVIKSREQVTDRPGDRVHHRLITSLNAKGGGTNIGSPLTKEHDGIRTFRKANPKTQCAVFVVSDSEANEGPVGPDLEQIVRSLRNDAVVVNFILGGAASDVESCASVFGSQNVVNAADVHSLTHRMMTTLSRIFFEATQRRR